MNKKYIVAGIVFILIIVVSVLYLLKINKDDLKLVNQVDNKEIIEGDSVELEKVESKLPLDKINTQQESISNNGDIYYIVARDNEKSNFIEKTIYKYSFNEKINKVVAGPYESKESLDHEFEPTIIISKDGSKAVITESNLYLILNNKIYSLLDDIPDKDISYPIFSPNEDKIAVSVNDELNIIDLSNNKTQIIQTTQEREKYYPVYWFKKNGEDHIVLRTDEIFSFNILDYNLNTKTFTEINKKLSTGEIFNVEKGSDVRQLEKSKKYSVETVGVRNDEKSILFYVDYQIDKNGSVILTELPKCNNKENLSILPSMSSWIFNDESEDLLCLESQSEFDPILSEVLRGGNPTEETLQKLNESAQGIIDNVISTGKVSFGKYNYFKITLKSKEFEILYEQNPIITLTSKDVVEIKSDASKIDNDKFHAAQLLVILLNSLKFSAEEELYEIIGQIDSENYFAIRKDYCDAYVNGLEIGIINIKNGYNKIGEYLPIKNEDDGSCHGDMHIKYVGELKNNL